MHFTIDLAFDQLAGLTSVNGLERALPWKTFM